MNFVRLAKLSPISAGVASMVLATGCGGSGGGTESPQKDTADGRAAVARCAAAFARSNDASLIIAILTPGRGDYNTTYPAYLTRWAGPDVSLNGISGESPQLSKGDCVLLIPDAYSIDVEHRGEWTTASTFTTLGPSSERLGSPNTTVVVPVGQAPPYSFSVPNGQVPVISSQDLSGFVADAGGSPSSATPESSTNGKPGESASPGEATSTRSEAEPAPPTPAASGEQVDVLLSEAEKRVDCGEIQDQRTIVAGGASCAEARKVLVRALKDDYDHVGESTAEGNDVEGFNCIGPRMGQGFYCSAIDGPPDGGPVIATVGESP